MKQMDPRQVANNLKEVNAFFKKVEEMKGAKHAKVLIVMGHIDNLMSVVHFLNERQLEGHDEVSCRIAEAVSNIIVSIALDLAWGEELTHGEKADKARELKGDFDAVNKLIKEAEGRIFGDQVPPRDEAITNVEEASNYLKNIMSKAVGGPHGEPH